MEKSALHVIALDLPTADEQILDALHQHQNAMQREREPGAAEIPFVARLAGWRTLDPHVRCWVVWDAAGSAVIANAWTEASREGQNAHLVNFNIMVLPAYRQRGIGRQLLAAVVAYARGRGSTMLITQTTRHRPAGAIWMQHIGAVPTLESRSSQLVLQSVDRALVQAWIDHAVERASGSHLGFWDGAYPADQRDAIAQFHTLHDNLAPRSGTSEAVVVDAQSLVHAEQGLFARGFSRWSAYVRESSAKALVGITEVTWNTQHPAVVEQGVTLVLPAYRQRGIGRWLKAAMLARIMRELPAAQAIATGNASDNAAMLAINNQLGFMPISEDTWWDMRLEQVEQYVARKLV